jgi:prepilin-type N-terminal cleavage/methylation domain-containing protein
MPAMISKYNFFKSSQGFSLVEMAIVLVIVGFLISAFLVPLSAQRDLRDYTMVKTDLEQIREALYGFAIINGRLPCPTNQPNPAVAGYGEEAPNCAAPVTEGYLPWKTLGVREIDSWGIRRTVASDPWVGYWRYRVNPSAAIPFTINTIFTPTLSVRDSAGNALTANAESPMAIVYSTGKNLNPDGENAGAFDGIYQSDVPVNTFDDVTVWISRNILMNRMVSAGRLP